MFNSAFKPLKWCFHAEISTEPRVRSSSNYVWNLWINLNTIRSWDWKTSASILRSSSQKQTVALNGRHPICTHYLFGKSRKQQLPKTKNQIRHTEEIQEVDAFQAITKEASTTPALSAVCLDVDRVVFFKSKVRNEERCWRLFFVQKMFSVKSCPGINCLTWDRLPAPNHKVPSGAEQSALSMRLMERWLVRRSIILNWALLMDHYQFVVALDKNVAIPSLVARICWCL